MQVLNKHCANYVNARQTNSYFCAKSAHGKLCFGISEPLCKPIAFKNSNITGLLQGPTWRKSRAGAVLLANRLYDGSRSRKTKGSLADTFQCNIWRRATLDYCWYWRGVLLFRIRVRTDMKDADGRSVLKDCDCAMIDCLYDYAQGSKNAI